MFNIYPPEGPWPYIALVVIAALLVVGLLLFFVLGGSVKREIRCDSLIRIGREPQKEPEAVH